MSNREVEAILKNGFPMTLSGTAVVVYFIIAYRYDTRPGKKTSYPGMDELMRATTKTRSTVQRALAELTNEGLIEQVQKGYRTKRAEYLPIHSLKLIDERDANSLPNSGEKESHPEPTSVALVDGMGSDCAAIASQERYLKSIPRNIRKVSESYDLARFEENVLSGLPIRLRSGMRPGRNIEELLDQLELKDISRKVIHKTVAEQNWAEVNSAGGIVVTVFKKMLAEKVASDVSALPQWCGACHKETMTVADPWEIPGRGGTTTTACPRCSRFSTILYDASEAAVHPGEFVKQELTRVNL